MLSITDRSERAVAGLATLRRLANPISIRLLSNMHMGIAENLSYRCDWLSQMIL